MIVATHMGLFFPSLRPDWRTLPAGAPELQIRARRRVDLARLRKFMSDGGLHLGPTIAIKNTDYQFRAYVTRKTWSAALAMLTMDIDYTKFKPTPQEYHGDDQLHDVYLAMWYVILDAFPEGSSWERSTKPKKRKKSA